jgi:hypothetical protein
MAMMSELESPSLSVTVPETAGQPPAATIWRYRSVPCCSAATEPSLTKGTLMPYPGLSRS